MGERVYTGSEPSRAADPQPARPAVPLNYGSTEAWHAGAWRATGPFREWAGVVIAGIGLRRIVFAFGLAFASGGVMFGLSVPYRNDEAALWTGFGGLLIGLTIPLAGFDKPSRT